mgnify:CR=1 FL=1
MCKFLTGVCWQFNTKMPFVVGAGSPRNSPSKMSRITRAEDQVQRADVTMVFAHYQKGQVMYMLIL